MSLALSHDPIVISVFFLWFLLSTFLSTALSAFYASLRDCELAFYWLHLFFITAFCRAGQGWRWIISGD